METIKLLIWDLDETFWKGTLSDGEITPVPENIELVKCLTDRGIVNSICSKNDYEKTKAKLEELGVWEYFVFPSIDWTPKGQRVKNIISDMNLRPVNCLFIDDNVNNLEEAKFATGGGINVSLPEDLPELLKDPAFEGKDDSEHSRLKQYKILEEKAAARAQSGSNEEFLYQSEIHVELIEDCSDKLVRIYEMIHRNNQLNFTKDRISQEEVDRIFTDPEITSGVVHVTDKYGDHGIIGCYAIKDGKALQLVFSCRILGMGVEQWVYAELGYPEIEVVGEVATELNKTDKPEWINNTASVQKETVTSSDKTPKLIVYGSCSLRPVWAYLQPKLPNAKFAEIDPRPCPLNLAVALRAADEQKREWMSMVGTINNIYTFDKEVYSEKTDYILITLQGIEGIRKYKSKATGSYFYSLPVGRNNADEKFLEDYICLKVTSRDMEEELSYICEHLSSNTTLLLQTLPEVEFPQKGKDADYYSRIEQNIVADKITKKYQNATLIDIRKYAKLPMDFFEPIPAHYNRNIGYFLASDIIDIMGLDKEGKKGQTNSYNAQDIIPDYAINQDFNFPEAGISCKIVTYILNGVFTAHIKMKNKGEYLFQYTLWQNRQIKFISELSSNQIFKANIFDEGLWCVNISFVNPENQLQICKFTSRSINLYAANYSSFIDPAKPNYGNAKMTVQNYAGKIVSNSAKYTQLANQVVEVAAMGINPFDYFEENDIYEIDLFIDEKVGNLIRPFMHNSNVKIRYIYTADKVWWLKSTQKNYYISDINGNLPLGDKDVVLLALNDFTDTISIFRKTNAKLVSLQYILSYFLTKSLFVRRLGKKVPKIIALRSANLYQYHAFPYDKLTANEKVLINNIFINEINVLKKISSDYENLPLQLQTIPKNKLLETMKVPKTYVEAGDGIQKFNDISENYVNIINGIRCTIGTPESYIGTVYICGGPQAFGYGVEDSETIASYLQKIIGLPYRIVNYSNCWFEDYTPALHLIENTEFKQNDIVVFLLTNWRSTFFENSYNHWLCWEAIEDPIIKVDAFPLFEKRDRPDYFLHRYGYTPECNLELAKLIRDAIYKNIKLFDIE